MKLKIINPDYGLSQEEIAVRVETLKKVARADTVIHMECPVKNNIYVDSQLDVAIDAPEIIEMGLRAEAAGYDALGIYCLSDPAIDALREVLNIPVIGGGQGAVLTAAMFGRNFSLITTSKNRITQKKEFIRTTGVDFSRLTSVRSIEFEEENSLNREAMIEELSKSAAQCVEDGADTVILGCMSFLGMAEEISRRAGVLIIDPGFTLVNMMELAVAGQLMHSKSAYPLPPKRQRHWAEGSINIK